MLFICIYFSDYWNYFRVLREERAEGLPESLEPKRHIIENITANVLMYSLYLSSEFPFKSLFTCNFLEPVSHSVILCANTKLKRFE